MAFAFDIDGVLYQGQTPIPGAREMLRKIRSHNIRYLFLTNGGGHHEDAKVASLAKRLQIDPNEDVIRNRVILSHTPMRGWDDAKKNGTVLITGSHPDVARKIAKDYGFKRVVTPADIIAADDKVFPFDNLRESLHSQWEPLPDGKSLPRLSDVYSKTFPPELLKIDQILVWNDPRDWALDIQAIHDLLISHQGYVGSLSEKNGDTSLPNNGWQQDGQPELWISNLDLVWKTEYPVNRFGTGAFVEALKGVWGATTGTELRFNALGKPSRLTYEYAHDRLLHHHSDLASADSGSTKERTRQPLKRVYMVGDNPESDIRGANEFQPHDGTEWVSILVKTGVWKETPLEREPRYRPAAIVDDVVDAIVWAMRNEGLDVDRDWVTAHSG
ncbi:HAD-like domain-containing protein [Stachybotrys elegans]|uniref:HAD-like domain-containing protein n=1 Tax=Stachybotrys elegans TaxID=80388 RepID=A0A8K0WPP0_9HYPO|nr:HAD-like domain-containing protein [Stachybotrys elegans]